MDPVAGPVMICAGEASADAHARDVIVALRARQPHLQIFGMGGRAMREVGFDAVVRAEEVAVAGLTEVVRALPRLVGSMRRLVRLARLRRPQVALLLDLPDFNLRLARRLGRLGIRVVYYISPQVWAWRRGRLRQIQAYVDEMLVILPFEAEFYRQHGVTAHYVGHPLAEQLAATAAAAPAAARQRLGVDATPTLALLPGSRAHEIARHLPIMLQAARRLQQHLGQPLQVLLPVASTIDPAQIERLLPAASDGLRFCLLDGQATAALQAAELAVVCSGTATLQAALLGRPMVVVYRVSAVTYQILRRLVQLPHIALVNLIAGRRLVPELVQQDFSTERLVAELRRLWPGEADAVAAHARMQEDLGALRQHLGAQPTAARVAGRVLDAGTDGRPHPTML